MQEETQRRTSRKQQWIQNRIDVFNRPLNPDSDNESSWRVLKRKILAEVAEKQNLRFPNPCRETIPYTTKRKSATFFLQYTYAGSKGCNTRRSLRELPGKVHAGTDAGEDVTARPHVCSISYHFLLLASDRTCVIHLIIILSYQVIRRVLHISSLSSPIFVWCESDPLLLHHLECQY